MPTKRPCFWMFFGGDRSSLAHRHRSEDQSMVASVIETEGFNNFEVRPNMLCPAWHFFLTCSIAKKLCHHNFFSGAGGNIEESHERVCRMASTFLLSVFLRRMTSDSSDDPARKDL